MEILTAKCPLLNCGGLFSAAKLHPLDIDSQRSSGPEVLQAKLLGKDLCRLGQHRANRVR